MKIAIAQLNYHIGNFAGNLQKMLDVVEKASQNNHMVPIPNSMECILGAMDQDVTPPFDPINYFEGWMDELRIWNVALNQEQIHQMMNQEIKSNGALVRGSTVPQDVSGLVWSNLDAYYQMNQPGDIVEGYVIPNAGTAEGRLRNIETWQDETAPIPYVTIKNGDWNDNAVTTPWLWGNSVWDHPNSNGVNGDPIDWNIVEINHDVTIKDHATLGRERSVQGLIINSGELTVDGNTACGCGNGLTVTHYLKLDGTIDLVGESQLIQSLGSDLDVTSSGTLERDQQGTADTFTYNYWSSPVGFSNNSTNNNDYKVTDVFQNINFLTSGYNGTISPVGIADYWIWKFSKCRSYY